MIGLSLSLSLGSYRAAGGTPPVTPTTLNATFDDAGANWTFLRDDTTDATKLHVAATRPTTRQASYWAGVITGTEAGLPGLNNSSIGQYAGMAEVSVDGGAFAAVNATGGEYPLFSGLEQGPHNVALRIGSIFGTAATYVPKTGTMLRVVGAPPSVLVMDGWVQPGDGNADTISSTAVVAHGIVNYLPANVPDSDPNSKANVSAVALRGTFSALTLVNLGNADASSLYVYVSVDGAAPTRYTGLTVLTGLSGEHTYYCWTGAESPLFSVGYVGTLSDIAAKKRLDQYGDSITEGIAATSAGEVEMFAVGAALGRMGGNFGISGWTIAELAASIATPLSHKTVNSNDVAVLAIGRNDTGGAFDATKISNYQSIVTALLTAGYGRVICRGILPETSSTWPTENGSIASIVTGFADARVVFCDTSSWSGIARSDGTHPTDAGYVTMRGYATPAYAALI